MNKTRIEWCDYSLNPVKGLCPMHCKNLQGYEYCYSAGERGLYKRFKWNPEIRLDKMAVAGIENLKSGSKIFWGSTIELFHDSIPWEYVAWIKGIVNCYPNLIHIFLTKQSQNLIKWSPFPENCWVGVTVTHDKMLNPALEALADIQVSKRFISIEPILERIRISDEDCELLDQIIIGQQTPISAKTQPKIEWIQEIVEAADKAGVPVFLKDNLIPAFWVNGVKDHVYFPPWATARGKYRQEFPKC